MRPWINISFWSSCSRIFVVVILLLETSQCLGKRRRHKGHNAFSTDLLNEGGSSHSLDSLLGNSSSSDLYGPWSEWTPCSNRHCTQRRTRECHQTKLCHRRAMKQKRPCREGMCSSRNVLPKEKKATGKRIEEIIYELLYYDWSEWSACTRSCKKRRYRTCALKSWCKNSVLLEEKRCTVPGTRCKKKNKDEDDEEEREPIEEDTGSRRKNKKNRPNKEESSETPDTPLVKVPYNASLCGIREITRGTPRIVGGYESKRGSWPWQVAILTKWHEQYCGGVLIASNWVLTAAHCVRRRGKKRKILVRIGEHDLSTDEGPEMDVRIASNIVHVDFDIDTIDNDIALLRLRDPIERSEYLGYACLPDEQWDLPKDSLCYAVGWGKMKETHLFGTDVLREAQMPIVDRETCQKAFDYGINENQLCAGYHSGGKDTCAGDSGGPLMCKVIGSDGEERWTVYGVTSFGEGCGDRGKYGIYSNVTAFIPWIYKSTDYAFTQN